MIDRILDWMGEHPVLSCVIVFLIFSGGCGANLVLSVNSK